MILQIEKVNPEGVKSISYLSDKFPTVLTKMSPGIIKCLRISSNYNTLLQVQKINI